MDKAELELRCTALRQELKIWEKTFTSENDGRKAGREDIKANADISRKYKEYNKARDLLLGKVAPQTPSKRAASRPTAQDLDSTPKAQPRSLISTPLKRKRDSGVEFADISDAAAEQVSPQGPVMIGPTPQRDGIVLGLFDLIQTETPSKMRVALAEVAPNVLRTPGTSNGKAESETSLESRARGEKTPLSTGKRFLLDRFVTPRKRKLNEERTPTSALKGLSTPAFLRRDNFLGVINEDGDTTPRPAPWKRRVLGRSLSSMIQSMKKQEDDRLDEEADIMRELEMEAESGAVTKKRVLPEILVEDSQPVMHLGPDGTFDSDNDDLDENETGDNQDHNGEPRKVWKKRGQKRQTRRVILRPNFVKPRPQKAQVLNEESEAGVEVQEISLYHEATRDDLTADDSEYASDASHTPKKRKTEHKKSERRDKSQNNDKNKEGSVTTVARKIKATTHANYRKLKIKSKSGNGGKGNRFGRRRR